MPEQSTLADLPFGWEERFASPQFHYFVDHLIGAICFSRPPPARLNLLLSQPNIANDITTLPGFLPAEVTYSSLVDQLVLIYRRSEAEPGTQPGLLQVLLDLSRPRDLSEEALRETLARSLQDDLAPDQRCDLDYIFWLVTAGQIDNAFRESFLSMPLLQYAPAQTDTASQLTGQLSGCDDCVASTSCPVTCATLRRDSAWCYLCMMDFSQEWHTVIGELSKLKMPSCGHIFHEACLLTFIRVHGGAFTCPLCTQTNIHRRPDIKNRHSLFQNDIQNINGRESQSRYGSQDGSESSENYTSVQMDYVQTSNQVRLPQAHALISHPLFNDEEELARLREFGETYQLGHERERERRERERREARMRGRERREAEKREKQEILRQERLQFLAQLPLMLYIPTFKGSIVPMGSTTLSNQQWEDQWVKSKLPFLQLEDNRSGCYVCLMDYDEPRKVDELCDDSVEEPEPVRLLPCTHACHQSCFDPWFLAEGTCPYCRISAFPQASSDLEPNTESEE